MPCSAHSSSWVLALRLPRPPEQRMGEDTEEVWRREAPQLAPGPECREASWTFQLRCPPADCSRMCKPSSKAEESPSKVHSQESWFHIGIYGDSSSQQQLNGNLSILKDMIFDVPAMVLPSLEIIPGLPLFVIGESLEKERMLASRYSPRQQLPATTFWVLRLLPRNVRSLATSSENQRVEACHQHHEVYGYFLLIQMRWQDNDQYGHGNNAVYYSYLDTIINQYLMRYCGLKTGLLMSPMVGFIATNQCTFHSLVSFPQIPVAVLVVEKVGHSSVHYHLVLFPPKPTEEPPSVDLRYLSDGFSFGHPKLVQFAALACTTGSSVHVFVNPAISKPVGLPEDFRRGLLWLMSPAPV
ncbi:PREDICTED: uncharacterized protein LOC103075296 [Lipotes vexillifer]|uniref:Uncharacterized protein LOC103075296 n=1 Tax=Lipotes vexillifer TaxID=118797 RepID=A0A340XHQ1_LIPVE|nr:PREDICTED: uncharacterized protein LOC103075296 [Lipotes vexillifer]